MFRMFFPRKHPTSFNSHMILEATFIGRDFLAKVLPKEQPWINNGMARQALSDGKILAEHLSMKSFFFPLL